MANYKVTVSTGTQTFAGTINNVSIRLMGVNGTSDWTKLKSHFIYFSRGTVSTFNLSCPTSLGQLYMIMLKLDPFSIFPADYWFPCKVEVKTPEEQTYQFPIYHWIWDYKADVFREAKALTIDRDPIGYVRKEELTLRCEQYCWDVYDYGFPDCIQNGNPNSLPYDVQFSITKKAEFDLAAIEALIELQVESLAYKVESWLGIDALHNLPLKASAISEYMKLNWKEDWLFGYQFLNGANPMVIRRCSVLPKNFPVTDSHLACDLKEEMQKGNIYLCDYKILDGVETATINNKKQYLMAPFVLLHKTPNDKMMPIAIQLKQTPSEDNPIFLPTDSTTDWLLAKTFVRSADFHLHELNSHLLHTHLLAEVFTVSLLRNIPMIHPLYKIMNPYMRYTLHINVLARQSLISDNGVFTLFTACGGKGMKTIMKKGLSLLTYRSLCIPDDIEDRGLKSVPNFYYKDDGLQLWTIIYRFVSAVLGFYYKSNNDVNKDSELQMWIQDIFEHGFHSNESTGIPKKFNTVEELSKFVTMVMFTCSAQHSAVNNGQFDYGGWMPNAPTTLKQPPPTRKGTTTERTLLETLPDVNITIQAIAVMWTLSKQSTDFVPLGQYPEKHFCEEVPCNLLKKFQEELRALSTLIKARNENLVIPYTYLNPELIEHSITI